MKRWLVWMDPDKGTEFASALVDSMFAALWKFGRWFRSVETKDGQEKKGDSSGLFPTEKGPKL